MLLLIWSWFNSTSGTTKHDIHVSELPVLSVELWGDAESFDDFDQDFRPRPLLPPGGAELVCDVTGDGILQSRMLKDVTNK